MRTSSPPCHVEFPAGVESEGMNTSPPTTTGRHPRRSSLPTLGLAAALGVGLMACGDDDDDPTPAPIDVDAPSATTMPGDDDTGNVTDDNDDDSDDDTEDDLDDDDDGQDG